MTGKARRSSSERAAANAAAAERDPLLLVHRLPSGEYSIAGKYSPASIKDQMVRAVALVDRLSIHGVLRSRGCKLLVVGAGAAGVSAAFRARDHGVPTTLVEVNAAPFERQRRSSRIVDPTEYDWPAPHWRTGTMTGNRLPLDFPSGPANKLVRIWEQAYVARAAADKGLLIRDRTRFLFALPNRNANGQAELVAHFESADGKAMHHWEAFDVVINCTGPGEESVSLDGCAHCSYQFWQDDQLEAPGFGLPGRPADATPPRILISGGGDGALQEFLRIAFPGMTPRDIYLGLVRSARLRAEIERRVFAAEDAFRRAWVWSEDARLDCQVLQRLHDAHAAVAADVAGKIIRPKSVDLSRLRDVQVAHSCGHFSVCYAFNRFLALLVSAIAGGVHFRPGLRLQHVEPERRSRHQCDGRAAWCWEHAHRVRLARSRCGEKAVNLARAEVWDIVVLRHGPKAGTPKLARQILPYGLPWG